MRYLLFILPFFALSCTSRKFVDHTTHKITYIYTDHDSVGNPLDSLKFYDDLPYEESLVFYEDTDSLEKDIYGLVYFSIFRIEENKFAILADSTHLSFYKFTPKGYKRSYRIEQPLGMRYYNRKTDLNGDNMKDIWLTISSGGSYGDDNYLLFYEPSKGMLIYNKDPELRNVEIEISNKMVRSFTRSTSDTYSIKGFTLHHTESTEFLQQENSNKKTVTYYNESGKATRTDTLNVPEEEY